MTNIETRIVDSIVKDLTDRRGLRQEWEGVGDEVKKEIRLAWKLAILKELNTDENESKALERQAVALVRQYRTLLMMAPPVKAFFKRLAVNLKWNELEEAL